MSTEHANLKELVKANRSYRGYDESRHVTRGELLEMVDCARLTASSVNLQPLRYYLAYEKEDVERIQPLTKWARGLPDMELPHPGMCPTAFIVICQDTYVSDALSRFTRDVGIVAQTILLCATEMGLGGCMIGNFSPAKIAEAVRLPESLVPLLVVAVGKPAEKVVLTEVGADGRTDYYRDEDDVHYVPKRRLEDLVIN
ncbi:MAG: nitroreductase family protein [Lachnospiraceae bacterium]|nr:nitroreductase family protein [Lachnospiraceae bacterium]